MRNVNWTMSKMLSSICRSGFFVALRRKIAKFRQKYDLCYRLRLVESKLDILENNLYYEMGISRSEVPKVMGLEETLEYIIKTGCSLCRYGDGEFELVAGCDMSFEAANPTMQRRLIEILQNPIPNCLCCIPNVFGSLARYTSDERRCWRHAAVWMRPLVEKYLSAEYKRGVSQDMVLGDALISRAYLGGADKAVAQKIFSLWKKVWEGQDILIVEGRFSRLGIGNDLFSSAKSIRRIWCPAVHAFEKYGTISETIKNEAKNGDLILLALGATATILAYDLAKVGYRALDVGHIDVEYMWMQMGATSKIAIPGRYVNEVKNGHEMRAVDGEEEANNVVAIID